MIDELVAKSHINILDCLVPNYEFRSMYFQFEQYWEMNSKCVRVQHLLFNTFRKSKKCILAKKICEQYICRSNSIYEQFQAEVKGVPVF